MLFTYQYDNLNRLLEGKAGDYQEHGITYDAMGNIKTLSRVYNNVLIDDLTYDYTASGNPTNQLQQITDATSYDDGLKHGNHSYSYDLNGNMYTDASKGLSVYYNMLNLPRVNTLSAGTISYTYDAIGQKLRKVNSIDGTTTDYINGIQYNDSSIDFVQTAEGRLLNPTTSPSYEYTLADHLGNTRVTFDGTGTLKQADDYLPFGMDVTVGSTPSQKNNYLYNNKELQAGLGLYDYGARLYDPVIGRWTALDPLADGSRKWSPYNYGKNNPIRIIDPDGMFDWVVGGSAGNKPVWDDNINSTADAQNKYGDGAKDVTENGTTYNYTHGGRGVVLNPNGSWDYTFSEMTQELPTGNGFEALQSGIRSMAPLLKTAEYTAIITANIAVTGIGGVEAGTNFLVGGVGRQAQFAEGLAQNATTGLERARELGVAGEEAVGITGPKISIEVAGRTRIPDRLTRAVLEEVKNVGRQSFTQQLRDFYQYSQDNGLQMILHTRPTTILSGPLQQLIDNGFILQKFIPGL